MSRSKGVKNTFGETVIPHEAAIEQKYERCVGTYNSIQRYLRRTDLDYQAKDPCLKRFLVLNITPYCKQAWNELIPAEFSGVVFSFDEGIVQALLGFVEPEIPLGERGEVTVNCERAGLPFPGRFDELRVQAVPAHDVLNGIEKMADDEDNVGKVSQCAGYIGLRRVYNALLYLCHLFRKKMNPTTHRPLTDKSEVVDEQLKEIVDQLLNEKPVIANREETLMRKIQVDESVTKYVKVGASVSPGEKC
ncbi:unnamed protein product [Orchesella dallaii]|uniref:Uncharacterized protein n=1 Tax=Orchesella dallaii TaxID=48710 RepID=A0ABP1Q0I6_9HEXA